MNCLCSPFAHETQTTHPQPDRNLRPETRLLTYSLNLCGFGRGREGKDNVQFLQAVLHLAKYGGGWRSLDGLFGPWSTIYSRFRDYCKRGVWECLFRQLVRQPRARLRFIDSTFIKCSIVSLIGPQSEPERIAGKSKGGFTTKVTALTDYKKRIYDLRMDPGHCHEAKFVREFITGLSNITLVGDKGFDIGALRRQLENQVCGHCIPTKSNAVKKESFNRQYYRMRHSVENVFGRLKFWANLETRRQRCPSTFLGFLYLYAATTWL